MSILNQRRMEGVSFRAERLEVSLKLSSSEIYESICRQIEEAMKTHRPHAVVLAGVYHGSETIRLETTGRNTCLIVDGQESYQTSFPLKDWCDTLSSEDFPVSLSDDAGQQGCNVALYWTLHILRDQENKGRTVFVHLPYTPRQAELRQCHEQEDE